MIVSLFPSFCVDYKSCTVVYFILLNLVLYFVVWIGTSTIQPSSKERAPVNSYDDDDLR